MRIYWDGGETALEEGLLAELEAAADAALGNDARGVSVSFITREEIRDLNARYRGVDAPTDVLSFPAPAPFDLETLGDVAVCVEIAEEQAAEYGHSLRRELAFLVVHGILHLKGFGHATEEGAFEMERMQNEVLNSRGILR